MIAGKCDFRLYQLEQAVFAELITGWIDCVDGAVRTSSTEITRGPFRRLCRRARLAAELKGKENLIRSDSYLAQRQINPSSYAAREKRNLT